jgi:hypothetical protein
MQKAKTTVFFVCFLFALAMAALAQEASAPGGPPPPLARIGPDPLYSTQGSSPAWGTTNFTVFHVSSAAFNPRHSSTTYTIDGNNGGLIRTGGDGSFYSYSFWAPVVLPAGAFLDGFRIFYYDNSPSNALIAWFTRYYGSASPSFQDIVVFISGETPGYTSDYVIVGKTITYRDSSNNDQNFNFIVRLEDTNMSFRGVRFLYYLQVSPAPASATFADVPSSHWAFQYVEALAASGITSGCGGGNFCPNSPLTRAQMAVLLAKALGLHWTGFEQSTF